MSTANTVKRITDYLTALSGEKVKAAMLAWTANADTSIIALEQALANEQNALTSENDLAEREHFAAVFPSMTESEMVETSLQSLAEYQRTGEGITQEDMEAWIATLSDGA